MRTFIILEPSGTPVAHGPTPDDARSAVLVQDGDPLDIIGRILSEDGYQVVFAHVADLTEEVGPDTRYRLCEEDRAVYSAGYNHGFRDVYEHGHGCAYDDGWGAGAAARLSDRIDEENEDA